MTTMEIAPTTTTAPAPVAAAVTEKGWHADPLSQHDLRYHDGSVWTEHVTHFGPVPCQGCNPFARS